VKLLDVILSGKSRRAALLDNGIYDVRGTDFAKMAAVHKNGTCYVGEGYRHQREFALARQRLQKSGVLPEIIDYEMRPLPAIAELYEGQSRDMRRAVGDTSKVSGQRRLTQLIADAVNARASDIRIMKHDTYTDVGARIAGREIKIGHDWTPEEGMQAILTAFTSQDEGSGEQTLVDGRPQSFSISPSDDFPLPRNVVKLRCQVGNMESETKLGYFLVARIFYKDEPETKTLEDLGLDQSVLDALARLRFSLRGICIIGGETGDGKSTTLVRGIEKLFDARNDQIHFMTIEDPVEIRVNRRGVKQVPLQSAGSEDDISREFHYLLRSFKRINADGCLVSEIRDAIAGIEVLRIGESGHAVYTTMHVDCAARIPFALINYGVPAASVAQPGLLRLLIKQTLAPRLCDHCKVPLSDIDLTDDQQMVLEPLKDVWEQIYTRNASGCAHCSPADGGNPAAEAWAGITRVLAVAEIIEPDEPFCAHMRSEDFAGANTYWRKSKADGGMGGIPLEAKLTELVLMGQLDPFDCLSRKGDLAQRMSDAQRAEITWRHE
jgi:type II secretory ATPase GspE/PulE/Tfp pilus assembly ATPase PilB-like protein